MPGTKNPVKQWEITFPQVDNEAIKETWWENFPPSVYSICCTETHEDGGKHLHMGIVFKKGISKANLLDWIIAKYPCSYKRIHISPIRVMSKWKDYCRKEDPNVYEREEKKIPTYTAELAMHDVMVDLFKRCQRNGDQRQYELSEERHLRDKYVEQEKHEQWLRENGYLPNDY